MYSGLQDRWTNMSGTEPVYANLSTDYDPIEGFGNMTFRRGFKMAFSVTIYRAMFMVIYSIIFIVCIVGNSLVLIVTVRSVRMKTRTNFFLANLAAADLCVGIMCVLPNLQTYLYFSWLLGKAMCKLYYFAESFTLYASVMFLAVIAIERYIAVMHPLRAKGLFTTCRMHTAQILIWLFSALYSVPLLIIFDTHEANRPGDVTVFCNIQNDLINLRLYFTINFILWYALPVITMSVVYANISWTLWHSGAIFNQQKNNDTASNASSSKTIPIVREQRSSGNVSSNSSYSDGAGSGAPGSVGECSQRDSGESVVCDLCRDNSINFKSRFCYSCNEDMFARFNPNDEDKCVRTLTRYVSKRSDCLDSTQPMLLVYEYGAPMCRSWSSSQDAGRGDDARAFRHQCLASRFSGDHHNKNNSFEMTCLTTTHPHYQRFHPKRTNGVINQTLPAVNHKRRSSRRSFHSDADSSPGQTPVYDVTGQRYPPTMSVRVLSSRRKVVRLLVLLILTYALCVLPHHVRLLMIYWNVYPVDSFGMSFFPPLAFISMYLNSALNPVLYSLFSESFRRSLRECLRRACQTGKSFFGQKASSCCRDT